MKAKHTPGPWSAVREDFRDYVGHTIENDDFILAETVTADAAKVTDEEAANAYLIAAAPDLLAAADALIAEFEKPEHDMEYAMTIQERFAVDTLRAAIAAAKGKA